MDFFFFFQIFQQVLQKIINNFLIRPLNVRPMDHRFRKAIIFQAQIISRSVQHPFSLVLKQAFVGMRLKIYFIKSQHSDVSVQMAAIS